VRSRKLGFVFQSFNLIPRTSALQNVELPLVYARVKPKERRERALAALRSVGLAKRAHHLPSELSGGQQQRAALARAIVSDPAIVLADEPTGNLDSHATAEILQVLSSLNAQGRTIIVITHEHDVAEACKRRIVLRDGLVIEDSRAVPVNARPPLLLAGVPANLGATA
jgi:putative ABC transport system ATP-binding protein